MLTGHRIGVYQILALLGAGGMGEVYRAHDPTLGRDVAIKLLPRLFTSDPDRLARFEREALMLASLNHPHIGAIYSVEQSAGVRALVLELVEGPTLADRLAAGPIPLTESLGIARQIAEALEAAHERGIVHRDLKPANIKITPDDIVKVLDFGLAKVTPHDGSAESSQSATVTDGGTREGVILGTAAYMSPEQARGLAVDKRTDIWAFGCVLFEMLTGRAPFARDTTTDALAAILEREPDWHALPPAAAPLTSVLQRCLEKDVKRRFRDIGDVKLLLEDTLRLPPTTASLPAAANRASWTVAAALGLIVVTAALVGVIGMSYVRKPADAPELRTEILIPATPDPLSFAISPDGRQVVFVASGVPKQLWLRALDTTTAQPLPGTDNAASPFWSPDSRSVAFFAGNKLKRLDIGAGLPHVLANVSPGRGGTWGPDGVVLFSVSNTSALYRTTASGGEPIAATRLGAGQVSHRYPQFLPGGRQFIFYADGQADAQGIYLGSLDTADTRRLVTANSAAVYAPPGWLLFIRGGTLVARRFDTVRGVLIGDPVTVADSVGQGTFGASAVSASATGAVMYRMGAAGRHQLIWFDRSGKTLGTLGASDDNTLIAPVVSPDGRLAAVTRTVQGNTDVWLIDAVRTSRFTVAESFDGFPVWSPDGSRIAFSSTRGGHFDLYVKAASGAGAEELLVESPRLKVPADWSRDGRYLLYTVSDDPKTGYDQWVLPLGGDRKPFPFLNATYNERLGQFSPDVQWVAYVSNESGRDEIYVRPFPGPGGQALVSAAGGISPRWSPDGKELYYIAPDATLMAAPMAVKGSTLEPGTPMSLFPTRVWGGGTATYQRAQYDVARDGRFLIDVSTDDEVTSPLTLLQNWKPKP
jgi:eukaryotic-like serine/threonine-protein kinase